MRNHLIPRNTRLLLALASAAVLAGCATTNSKPLYSWTNYEPQVYDYLKGSGNGVEAQISKLEEATEKARATGQALPPGYHAHLGMLYAKAGRTDQVQTQFEAEKTLFPESSTFIEFLSRTFAKNNGGAQ